MGIWWDSNQSLVVGDGGLDDRRGGGPAAGALKVRQSQPYTVATGPDRALHNMAVARNATICPVYPGIHAIMDSNLALPRLPSTGGAGQCMTSAPPSAAQFGGCLWQAWPTPGQITASGGSPTITGSDQIDRHCICGAELGYPFSRGSSALGELSTDSSQAGI